MAKSPHALPMLFFNLGGEMLYVLDQRLKAQKIVENKANKVLCDIVGQMFEEKFLAKVFTPQVLLSNREVRLVFDRLAHASFMRLNPSSMDKLYDLMTMAFKYQVMLCRAPEDLLLVTFNHLDAIREMVTGSDKLIAAVNDAHRQLRAYYKGMNNAEFQTVRHTLLFFFQDIRKRVSILLRDKAQLSDGHFVLPVGGPVARGADVPGTIRYFENEAVTRCETFVPALPFTVSDIVGSHELQGDRVTNLGTNLYSIRKDLDAAAESVSNTNMPPAPDIGGDPSSKEEFNLLSHLIHSGKIASSSSDIFKLNLFSNDDNEEASSTAQVVNINASKGDKHLQHILKDFSNLNTVQESDDILDLLDQAAS